MADMDTLAAPGAVPQTDPIQALMASLAAQPQQQAPAPQAEPQMQGMMAPPAAPPQAAPQGLMGPAPQQGQPPQQDGGAGGLFKRMLGNVFPQDPSLSQIISPDEIAHNRRSAIIQAGLQMMRASSASDPQHPGQTTLGALGQAGQAGIGAYDQANAQSVQAHQLGQQQATYQRQMQARQDIAKQYQPVAGETLPAQAQRMDNMAAAYTNAGLVPEAETMAKAAAALHTRLAYGAMGGLIKDTPQGLVRVDPNTNTVIPITGPDGKQVQSNAVTEADRMAQRAQVTAGRAQSSAVAEANGFRGTMKTITDQAGPLTKAQTTLDQIVAGNPAALHSLPGVVATLEPMKPQLRAQMVQWMANVNPSWQGQIQTWLAGGMNGQLPPDQAKMVGQFLKAQVGDLTQRYTQGYQALSPAAQKRLQSQSPDVLFKPLKSQTQAATAATATPQAKEPQASQFDQSAAGYQKYLAAHAAWQTASPQ